MENGDHGDEGTDEIPGPSGGSKVCKTEAEGSGGRVATVSDLLAASVSGGSVDDDEDDEDFEASALMEAGSEEDDDDDSAADEDEDDDDDEIDGWFGWFAVHALIFIRCLRKKYYLSLQLSAIWKGYADRYTIIEKSRFFENGVLEGAWLPNGRLKFWVFFPFGVRLFGTFLE